jgi:hypothetical protein
MVFKGCLPSRYRIGILGMTACSLLYTLRVNLNVAIVAMVRPKNSSHPQDWCYNYNGDDYKFDNLPVIIITT